MTTPIDRRIRDDQWWAWLAAACAAVIGLSALLDDYSDLGTGLTAVSILGWVANAAWRRLPALALALWVGAPAVILNAVGGAEGTMFLLVLLTGYLAVLETRRRIVTVVASAAILAPFLITVAGGREDWGWNFWMIGIAFGWLFGTLTFRHRRLLDELESTRRLLADRAVLEERRRIARDLHDLVGHSLTVVMLHLTGARRLIRRDPDEAEAALLDAETVGRQSLADMRRSVRLLSEGEDTRDTAPSPTAADIATLVERYAAAGMHVGLAFRGTLDIPDQAVGLALYRIVQESLANVARHAPGSSVEVNVECENSRCQVKVENHGGSRDQIVTSPPGIGIAGIRERAASLGGSLRAGPTADGWQVEASLPLDGTIAGTP